MTLFSPIRHLLVLVVVSQAINCHLFAKELTESSSCLGLLTENSRLPHGQASFDQFLQNLFRQLNVLPQKNYAANIALVAGLFDGRYSISELMSLENEDEVYERLAKAMNRLHAGHQVQHRSEDQPVERKFAVPRERILGVYGASLSHTFWATKKLVELLDPTAIESSEAVEQMAVAIDQYVTSLPPEGLFKRINRAAIEFLASEEFREKAAAYKTQLLQNQARLDKQIYIDLQTDLSKTFLQHLKRQAPELDETQLITIIQIYTGQI